MTTQWYYIRDGDSVGPIDTLIVQDLISAGLLSRADFVRQETSVEWKAVSEFDDFQFTTTTQSHQENQRESKNPPPVVEFKGLETPQGSTHDEAVRQPRQEKESPSPQKVTIDERPHAEAADTSSDFNLIKLFAVIAGAFFLLWLLGWYSVLIWAARACLAIALILIILAFIAYSDRSDETEEADETLTFGVLLIVPALLFAWISFRSWGAPPGGVPKNQLHLASAVLEYSATEKDAPQLADAMKGHGSAFVIGQSGSKLKLMTNAHCLGVIELLQAADLAQKQRVDIGTYRLTVTFPSGKQRTVDRIAVISGKASDAAQLEVDADGLVEGRDYLTLPYAGDVIKKLNVAPGSPVIAVGTPFHQSYQGTQSFGHVGAVRNSIDGYDGTWIQHDAKITFGNSGGPLLVENDDLAYWIGINTRGVSDSQISLALSADSVMASDFTWNDATPVGIAHLIRTEIGFDATGDRITSTLPRKSFFDLELPKPEPWKHRWLLVLMKIVVCIAVGSKFAHALIVSMKPLDESTPEWRTLLCLVLIPVVFVFCYWLITRGLQAGLAPTEWESLSRD